MRKLAVVSAIAVSFALPANLAIAADYEAQVQQLVVSGVVDSWSGYTLIRDTLDLDEAEYFSSGLSGRLSLPLGDMLSIQMDGDLEYTSNTFERTRHDDEFYHSWQLGAHLSARDPDFGLIGVFGGFGTGVATDAAGPENPKNTGFIVGGEAQLYLDNLTFYVQGGYFDGDADDQSPSGGTDAFYDAVFVRGVARWFITPNSRLQGELSYVDGLQDSGPPLDSEILEWAARYDIVLEGVPVIGDTPVYVGYRGAYFDTPGEPAHYMEHTFMVGTKYSFGGSTMKEFDRVGASLDLPGFTRWIASGQPQD